LATALEKRNSVIIKARRPVTIITNHRLIEAESRDIAANVIFAHCKEQLRENETCRIFITLRQKR
jgi:hypothetical protein